MKKPKLGGFKNIQFFQMAHKTKIKKQICSKDQFQATGKEARCRDKASIAVKYHMLSERAKMEPQRTAQTTAL